MTDEVSSTQVVPAPMDAQVGNGAGWGDGETIASAHSPLERPLAAIRRYKFILAGVVALSLVGGIVATRLVKPDYEVQARIWIQSLSPSASEQSPVRTKELLGATAWIELLQSFRVSDAVVQKLSLFLKPKNQGDSTLFQTFAVSDRGFLAGDYKLEIEKRSARWKLTVENTPVADSGVAGDSIGRKVGLRWKPEPRLLGQFMGKTVLFSLATPRETSIELYKRLTPRLTAASPLLRLSYTDPDPALAAKTLNTWVNEFVSVAGEMKTKNAVEFAKTLGGQLTFAEASLKVAETSLENFRIHTIALPAEGGPIAGGIQLTQGPAMQNFFAQKIELDNLKQDRIQLEKVIAAKGALPYESVLLLPSVANSPGGGEIRKLFEKLYVDQSSLTAARQTFTDDYGPVKDLSTSVNQLRTKTIPDLVAAQLAQVKEREAEIEQRVASASGDLQAMPSRTIEEMRLRRAVLVAENLYTALKAKYAEAQLAAASTAPDVNVMDSAVAPLQPTSNTAPKIIAMAILGGLGAAIGLALLLDRLDGRIRYPEQVTKELGLTISATVPLLPKGGVVQQTPEQLTQLVESFRTLRMNVMNASHSRVSIAVSSPSPADGKSFIASNLAMSCADAGLRTVLVDADTRRGALHDLFQVPRRSGLTDFLAGEAHQNDIMHATGYDKLTLIPSGRPRRQSPELLVGAALKSLVAELRTRFDVIIFDTPPLAAGIDAYAIAAATGGLLMVLRIGHTERRMAVARLDLVGRLPITVVGSVLNGVPTGGEYEYYGYVSGYSAVDEQLSAGQQVAEIGQ